MMACPSDLFLEAYLLDVAGRTLQQHIDACPRCHRRLAHMEHDGEEFILHVYPATVGAVLEAAGARGSPQWPVYPVAVIAASTARPS